MGIFGDLLGNDKKYDVLTEYSCSEGGSMTGGHKRETIKIRDGKVIRTTSFAEWHNDTPTVEEYVLDSQVLVDIAAVFKKHKMYKWHNMKFTNMFISDGASTSYNFSFGREYVHFSSQIYPGKYRNKLAEIKEVIEKYMENATKI